MASAESGGPVEQINYFPQNPNYNQNLEPGTWRKMEEYVKSLKEHSDNAGKTIRTEVTPVFPAGSKRPNAFQVEVFIDNTLITIDVDFRLIPNP